MKSSEPPRSRYALYFTPGLNSPWERFGSAWLGRRAFGDLTVKQTEIEGVPTTTFTACTSFPRRYGFHATLKAPFRMADDMSLEDLICELDEYCHGLTPFALDFPELKLLGRFLALAWERDDERVLSIAHDCVTKFDVFRAPLESAEIERRRKQGLSSMQDELLLRWGYPHVLEAFRFHFSLTGALQDLSREAVRKIEAAAGNELSTLKKEPMMFDAISIFEEALPGTALNVVHQSRLRRGRGRLIYVVGPSGSGKDSIIAFARDKLLGNTKVRFAKRTITRPNGLGAEDHEAVLTAEFQEREESGQFAMAWTANGNWYGVGKEILSWLASGYTVVVNGSRSYLSEARSRFPELESVLITADPSAVAGRLHARGRDSVDEMKLRLARNARLANPDFAADIEIDNGGRLEIAGERFLAFVLAKEKS